MNKGLKEKAIELFNQGFNYSEIQEKLNCSKGALSYHLHDLKIQQKEKQNKIKLSRISIIEKEHFNSLLEFDSKYKESLTRRDYNQLKRKLFPYKRTDRFKKDPKKYYRDRRKQIKQSLIDYKGGCCSICGYNKCIKALHFHHLDPNIKNFNVSHTLKSLTIESLKEEVEKCIIVCANCHAEIHA